jgi:hypothetical protein
MTTPEITIESLVLKSGKHATPAEGLCVMEAVAYFRGIEHTDHPACVSRALGAFLRSWNDSLDDATRQRLKPYILKVVGTNTGAADEQRRARLATDWLVRTHIPAWLELAGLKDHATALRTLPQLTSSELAAKAQTTIAAAGAAARVAAWDAAWDALQSTVETLQESAFALLDHMIAVGKVEVKA